MSDLHPEYPGLVKAALASDAYWDYPQDPFGPLIAIEESTRGLIPLRQQIKLTGDGEKAQQIGTILASAEDGGSIESVAYGEEIPPLHGRQVVKVVEDSRRIIGKLSLGHLSDKAYVAYLLRKGKKHNGPDFKFRTFEENLQEMYASELPYGVSATAIVKYSMTKLARVRREVLYMRLDQASGLFTALRAYESATSERWEEPAMELIPNVPIGTTYSKAGDGNNRHIGKIVSAEVVEAYNVTWQSSGSSSGSDKKKKAGKVLRPVPTRGIVPS